MEKAERLIPLHFEIEIDATPDKVYRVMIDQSFYSEWTSAFDPSSRFEGSWDKGSEIRFIGEGQDGTEGGMVSRIRESIPGRYISIEHLGLIKNGKVITEGEGAEQWTGALEDYLFFEREGKTLLTIDVDTNKQYRDFFIDTWPKALLKLKEICESKKTG